MFFLTMPKPRLVWQQQLVEPNANEYEWAMKFSIGIIIMPHLSEASCLQYWVKQWTSIV
jgi:hypothetical protein